MSTPLISPSVQDLIQSVRNLLSQPDPNNSNWTDSELLSYINEAVRIYFAELSEINEGYFVSTDDLDIVSGTQTIALPSDFFKIKNVWKKVSNGYVILKYRNNVTEGYSTQGGGSTEAYFPDYSFRGNSLLFSSVPNFSETDGIKVEYVAMPATLLNGADQMTAQISPIFKQVVEMYAVYKAKVKESLVSGVRTSDIAAENLRDLLKQFREVAQIRSKNPTYILPFNPESC